MDTGHSVHRVKDRCLAENIDIICLPGTQSVYVKTWGCSHNNSDSEYMAGQLAAYGYIITGTGSYVMHSIDMLSLLNLY